MQTSSEQSGFVWSGREDNQESGPSQHWQQKIRPWNALASGGVTLIGFACDEGVRRNKGCSGAAAGPNALRAVLASLPVLGEPDLFDAGDVSCVDVLPGSCAPGVSAPAALGLPLAHVEKLIDGILSSGRLVAAGNAELNPEMDRDNLTAKTAARLTARIARGWR